MKSNVRLPPDGILSPSPCSFHFQEHLQSLAYGSLPSISLSRWHLKPISDDSPISNNILESSVRLIPQRNLQMASVSPFPHHHQQRVQIFRCTPVFNHLLPPGHERQACQSNPSSTRRLNRGSCHTPKFALLFLKAFHTSMLKDSSRVDQTNSPLGTQPKLGFGNSQIQMDFQHLQWSSCLLICFKESPCQVSSLTSQVSSDNCSKSQLYWSKSQLWSTYSQTS